MSLLRYSLLCVLLAALSAASAAAQMGREAHPALHLSNEDPGSLFTSAYTAATRAESLARAKDYSQALEEARKAERILAAIARDRPDWRANVVAYRRQENHSNIERWTKELQANPRMGLADSRTGINESPVRPPGQPVQPGAGGRTPSFDELETIRSQRNAANRAQPSRTGIEVPRELTNPQSPYERLEREKLTLMHENNALVKALRDTRLELERAIGNREKAKAGEAAYSKLYQDIKAELDKERRESGKLIANLTERYNQVEQELKDAQSKNAAAEKRLAELELRFQETAQQLADVSRERDAFKTERDELAEILKHNSPDKTKQLLDNNLTLAAQLAASQKRIEELETERSDNADQLAVNLKELENTQAEIAKIRVLLAAVQDENMGFRRRISELNTKLLNAEADLEKQADDPDADPAAMEEKRLMASLITKQLTIISTQQKARQLIIDEFRKLNSDNPYIDEAIKLFEGDAKLELTPAEEALVKSYTIAETPELSDDQISGSSRAMELVTRKKRIEILGNAAADSFSKGRFAAAEQLYLDLLEQEPDHFAGHVNLGTIMIRKDDAAAVDEAINLLSKANAINPNVAQSHFMLGVAYYRKGADRNAIEAFTQVTALQPDHADAFLYMGNIEGSAGNYREAIQYYDKALAIDGDYTEALLNKSDILARTGKLTQARQAYDEAIQKGAEPDLALLRVLDPKGVTLPNPAKGSSRERSSDRDESRLASSPEPSIERVEARPQTREVKDAAAAPDLQDTPPALAEANRQPVSHVQGPSTAKPEPAEADKESAKPSAVKEESRRPAAEGKPKNRRWFRFG